MTNTCTRRLSALSGLLLLLAAPAAQAQGWKLTWGDEFNYSGLPDSSKWNYERGWARNNELQFYTVRRPENAKVENGSLFITLRKEAIRLPDTVRMKTTAFTSACLTTKQRHEPLYGKIEARIKGPEGKAGIWPAFWMLGAHTFEQPKRHFDEAVRWPNPGSDEIDIWEYFGKSPFEFKGGLFMSPGVGCADGGNIQKYRNGQKAQDWHTYGLEWFPDSLRWTWNGQVVRVQKQSEGCQNFDRPMFYLLNFALGGDAGGPPAADLSFPQVMEVDWVRFYEDTTARHTRLFTTPLGLGKVTPVSSGKYRRGEAVELVAEPVPGWRFVKWTGDVTGNTNPMRLVLDGDKRVEALFEPMPGRNLALDAEARAGTRFGNNVPAFAMDADTTNAWVGDSIDTDRNWFQLQWKAWVKMRTVRLRLEDIAEWKLELYTEQNFVELARGTQSSASLDLGAREGEYLVLTVKPAAGKRPRVKEISVFAGEASSSLGRAPAPQRKAGGFPQVPAGKLKKGDKMYKATGEAFKGRN